MDNDTVADALDVLRALPAWRLPAARWDRVRQHLGELAGAWDRGDAEALEDAVLDLRLCASNRGIDPIKGKSGAPDEVLDRIAPLVHSLAQPRKGPAGATKSR